MIIRTSLSLLFFLFLCLFLSPRELALASLPPGNTSFKKGVGRGWSVGTPEELQALGVSWAYNWGLGPSRFNQNTYQHIPMVRAGNKNYEAIKKRAQDNPGSYWLIFNEPDFVKQDNIGPAAAAEEYHALRSILKEADPTAKLIVGGIYFSALGNNLGWLREFRGEYYRLYKSWPEVEGWHAHIYMGWSNYNKDEWRRTVTFWRDWMINNGGTREFWLTEFGILNSEPTAKQLMQDQVAWLENSAPWITRYAWFATMANGGGCPGCTGSLLQGGGLSNLGKLYATFGHPPSPLPTPVFTLQFLSGWNSLFWQDNFPSAKRPSTLPPSCIVESSRVSLFWKPFVRLYQSYDNPFTLHGRYPVRCRNNTSWGL